MKNNRINIIYALLIVLFFVSPIKNNAQDFEMSSLIASSESFVADLSGVWQRSYDGSEWEDVRLPQSVESTERIIFQRTLRIEKSLIENKTWHIHFLGIDHQVEVFFNDQFVGRYFGGMSSFRVRIPDRMVSGETNTIKLIVSEAESYAKQIREQNLFAEEVYTGVIRELYLVGTPHLWVDNINYKLDFDEKLTKASIKANISVSSGKISVINKNPIFVDSNNTSSSERTSAEMKLYLIDLKGDTVSTSEGLEFDIESERTLDKSFNLNVEEFELWTPNKPTLYKLVGVISKNDIVIDKREVNFSFKELSVKTKDDIKGVYLNNEPFEIKGVSYIEDLHDINKTLTLKSIENDVALLKRLGANVIRVKFTAPHPYLVELCDREGIMIFVELPVYDVPASIIGIDEIKVHLKNIANQLLETYNNHPSVVAWGISDGVNESSSYFTDFCNEQTALFRKKSDKLIYKIAPFGSTEINTDNFDLIGFKNYNHEVDFNAVKEELIRLDELSGNIPIFMVYGEPIQPKNRNGYSDPLSVEFQANNILNSYRIVKELNAAGSIVNTFNDYKLENPLLILNNQQQYINTSGLFDRDRQQRVSFTTLQSLFNNETEPLLNAGSFTPNTPVSFIVIGIILLVILVLIINRFKRFREYLSRSLLRPYNFYADIRDQRIMSNIQTIVLGVIISLIIGIYLASILYYFRTSEEAQYILMMLVQSNQLKEFLYKLVWMPEVSLFILSSISLLLAFVIALIIRIFALFVRAKIFLNDCFTITVWSATPVLLLLPVAIILFRILVVSPQSVVIFLGVGLIFLLWLIRRKLRSIAVVFDQPSIKVYFIGIFILIALIGVPLVIYQLNNSIFAYTQYFIDVLLKMNT